MSFCVFKPFNPSTRSTHHREKKIVVHNLHLPEPVPSGPPDADSPRSPMAEGPGPSGKHSRFPEIPPGDGWPKDRSAPPPARLARRRLPDIASPAGLFASLSATAPKATRSTDAATQDPACGSPPLRPLPRSPRRPPLFSGGERSAKKPRPAPLGIPGSRDHSNGKKGLFFFFRGERKPRPGGTNTPIP